MLLFTPQWQLVKLFDCNKVIGNDIGSDVFRGLRSIQSHTPLNGAGFWHSIIPFNYSQKSIGGVFGEGFLPSCPGFHTVCVWTNADRMKTWAGK